MAHFPCSGIEEFKSQPLRPCRVIFSVQQYVSYKAQYVGGEDGYLPSVCVGAYGVCYDMPSGKLVFQCMMYLLALAASASLLLRYLFRGLVGYVGTIHLQLLVWRRDKRPTLPTPTLLRQVTELRK